MLLAVLVPGVAARLNPWVRVPLVVGEMVAGMIFGQSGLHWIQPTPVIRFLAEFGFIYLMFLSGLEMDFGLLTTADTNGGKSNWRERPLILGVLVFVCTAILAVLFGMIVCALGLAQNPILMGLILSTTSMGIVMPVLKERGHTTDPFGQVVLLCSLLGDFVTLFLFSLLVSVISKGFSPDLLLFVVLLALFGMATWLGPRISGHRRLRRMVKELSGATAQIRVRWAFALMVAWVVISDMLGVEVILGAFLAGTIISYSRRSKGQAFPEKLEAMGYGFFIPIFFIMVGARFDVRALLQSSEALLLVPLLMVAAYLVKVLPSLLLKWRFSWRQALAAGVLLSSRLSLLIAASAIALDLGLITPATNSAVILVAIVTCTCSPVLFNRLLPVEGGPERDGVIIFGTDQLAELLAARLARDGEKFVFIGRDHAQLERLRERGQRVVIGDPVQPNVLDEAGARTARALVAVSNSAPAVLEVCRLARTKFGVPSLVARADEPEEVRKLQALQVQVVQPSMAMALGLEGALHFPAAFSSLLNKSNDFDLVDVPLRNSGLVGQALRQVRLPGDALVLGIRREGEAEVVVPHGDTILREGDVLMLVGHTRSMREARRWILGREREA